MSVIAKELNYESKSVEHGTYTFSRITPQNNTGVTLNTAGGQTSVFEIPSNVVNFSKSFLSFSAAYGADAALANKIHCIGAPMIRSISLVTREGLFLCDLQQCNRYLHTVLPAESRNEEWTSTDSPKDGLYSASGINRNLGIVVGEQQVPGLTYAVANSSTYTTPYNGLQHLIQGAATAAAAVKWSLPMSILKNSILSLNLDQYFGGQSIFLTITWESRGYSGYVGTPNVSGADVVLPADIVISSLYFNLAIETNTVAQMVARTNKSYSIPYVYTSKLAFAAAGLQSTQVRFNRSQGSKLRKIYWAPFSTDETVINAFNHTNVGASAVSTFYSLLNNQRLQQFNPSCASLEDYYLIRGLLKGTPLESTRSYYQLYLWIEDFTSGLIKYDDSFLTDGVDLSEDILYTFNATGLGAQTHQVFSVVERTLHLEDGRITLS